jgi:signal transduction histidine kinase/ligand-binding sensor domain-containing protein
VNSQQVVESSSAKRAAIKGLAAILLATTLGLTQPAEAQRDLPAATSFSARQTWTTDNGLPQNSVHAITQSADGFLWIATEAGLARFDGYTLRVFDRQSSPALPADDIRCLIEDVDGSLWIGTAAGLAHMKHGRIQNYTTTDGLPSASVQSLLLTRDGTLWVRTTDGFTFTPHSATQQLHFEIPQLGHDIRSITLAAGGGVLAATDHAIENIVTGDEHAVPGSEAQSIEAVASLGDQTLLVNASGLEQLSGSHLRILAPRASLPPGLIDWLLPSADGVWVGGHSAVSLIRPQGNLHFECGKNLSCGRITDMLHDSAGVLLIATDRQLLRWDGRSFVSLADDLPGILSVFEDRQHNLWIGTESDGLVELRRPLFSLLSSQTQNGASVASLFTVKDRIYAGTGGDGIQVLSMDSTMTKSYSTRRGLASDTVLALAGAADSIWAGTPDGLTRLAIEGSAPVRTLTTLDGLADDSVTSLLLARDGALWVGTPHGITRLKDGNSNTYTTAQGLGSNLVGPLLQDSAGDLWVGTLNGLTRIRNGNVTNYTTADGLPGNTITALAQDPVGNLWIGVRAHAVALRAADRFVSFEKVAALPRTPIEILADAQGSLWFNSDRGIDRVDISALRSSPDSSGKNISVDHYGVGDGLSPLQTTDAGHPTAIRLDDGRLAFATRRGIALFNPSLRASPPAGAPVLEDIVVDDRESSRESISSLPPGTSRLSFNFAAVDLVAPHRLQYRYRLEGFDSSWIQSGTRRTAFYTSLPPGKYRFRVAARSGSSPWIEMAAPMDFQIQPHFYQTLLFRFGCTLLVAALLFGIYRLRLQSMRRQFSAISAERTRLAREIHDTLAQGYVAVSMRLEILSRILAPNRIEDCRTQLNETRTLVQDGLAEARRSIWDLRAQGEEATSLPARMHRLAALASRRDNEAQFSLTGIYREVATRLEDEMYRIAQEAIANAVRHSGASRIALNLAYTEDAIRMKITDNGCGFDLNSIPSGSLGHFGITGMRERAESIGAQFSVETEPGSGTSLHVLLQITPQRKRVQSDA